MRGFRQQAKSGVAPCYGEEQLRLAQESVDIQQRSYDIVQILYRNGDSSELDALQAQTLLLSTQTVIPSLEATIAQSKNALSVLLGVAPSDIDDLLGEGALPDVPESIAVGVPANLLRQRPDVRKAELQALAQNALVGVAETNLYPSFSLDGTLGFYRPTSTITTWATCSVARRSATWRAHPLSGRF